MMVSLYYFRTLHGKFHDWIAKRFPRLSLYLERIKNPHAAYLVLTPEHGNLGDHAIALSETNLLSSLGIPYIEVTGKTLLARQKRGLLQTMNGRPIIINGGGNLGTLWLHNELVLRDIMQKAPKSRIFVLPSTVYYDNTPDGMEEYDRSVTIYNNCKHLKLYAREGISYDFMRKAYKDVTLVPDMALSMVQSKPGLQRNGCILCLRKDRERTLSDSEWEAINRQAEELFNNITPLDMVAPYQIPVKNREIELEKQFDQFRHAELVITDRLHGMIFCAITGTPCIVINSKSPKVRGCYEWIKDLPYIQFCDDLSQISAIYQSIPKKDWQYDNSKLLPYYKQLEQDLMPLGKRKRTQRAKH